MMRKMRFALLALIVPCTVLAEPLGSMSGRISVIAPSAYPAFLEWNVSDRGDYFEGYGTVGPWLGGGFDPKKKAIFLRKSEDKTAAGEHHEIWSGHLYDAPFSLDCVSDRCVAELTGYEGRFEILYLPSGDILTRRDGDTGYRRSHLTPETWEAVGSGRFDRESEAPDQAVYRGATQSSKGKLTLKGSMKSAWKERYFALLFLVSLQLRLEPRDKDPY
jgi:hypothetical protein